MLVFMIFLFPAVFVLTLGAAFGGFGSPPPAYPGGVVNLDQAQKYWAYKFMLITKRLKSTYLRAKSKRVQSKLSFL